MTLSVHVGAHKTASTHLQQSLRSVLPQMLRAGVIYSDGTHLRGGGKVQLDASLGHGDRARRHRAALRRRLDRLDEIWPETLISEENILGTVKPESLLGDGNLIYPHAGSRMALLAEAARQRPMTVFMSVREPVSFLTSAFLMRLQGGREADWVEFLGGFDPAALSWAGLAERLLAVRSVARLVVWRYEDYAAIRPAVLARMLPAALVDRVANPPPAMVGLSQAAVQQVLGHSAGNDTDTDLSDLARAAKSAYPRRKREAAPMMGDDATQCAAQRAYEADLDRMAALPRVELLRP